MLYTCKSNGSAGFGLAADHGAEMALSNKTLEDIQQVREEMLSTTIDDLRGFADFVEEMVGQNKVFAVLGRSAADSAEYDFEYYADASTLEIYIPS